MYSRIVQIMFPTKKQMRDLKGADESMIENPRVSGRGRVEVGMEDAEDENCCIERMKRDSDIGSQTVGTTNHLVRVKT